MHHDDYQIALLDHEGGLSLKLRIPGRRLPWILAALAALGLIQAVFFGVGALALRQELSTHSSAKTLIAQRLQTLALLHELDVLESGLSRAVDFNARLQVMLSQEPGQRLGRPNQTLQDLVAGRASAIYLPDVLRRMQVGVRALAQEFGVEETYQVRLASVVESQRERLSRIPCVWPTRGRYSSGFGDRHSLTTSETGFHKGIDITAPVGTPVYATANGRVFFAGFFSTYGNCIDVDHGSGLSTRYAHLSRIEVDEGQAVTRGQRIGRVGSTGRSFAPHLHYEVHLNDSPVNPRNYIIE